MGAFGDLDAVKDDGVADFGVGDDAAAADERVVDGARVAVLVEEFGRRGLFGARCGLASFRRTCRVVGIR